MNLKFRGINRNDAFEELANVDSVPIGLRQLATTAIDRVTDSEIEVEFSYDLSDTGLSASVTVKILGPPRPLPFTLTRDQIVEARGRGRGIPKD